MNDFTLQEFQFESQTSYTIIEEIGRGGMGIVYLAARYAGGVTDYVVLKTLRPLSPQEEESLRAEVNIAATLRHENIVKSYGLETLNLDELPATFQENLRNLSYLKEAARSKRKIRRLQFRRDQPEKVTHVSNKPRATAERMLLLVVDYVDGMDLHELHQEHLNLSLLLPAPFAAFIISRIARALGYAHNYMIHQNISPKNILINTHGICKLSDFGISVAIKGLPDYFAGKLPFMAPEQINKRRVDETVDIFALGAVAYHVLTGIPMFQVKPGLSLEKNIQNVKDQLAEEIPAPHQIRKDIPVELSQIVARMTKVTPQSRYQRAVTVANDFEKKYLYQKGYGPTNNSLATYLSIFENRFSAYNEEQLDYLSFLKNEQEDLQLKRRLDLSQYTDLGQTLLQKRLPALYKQMQSGSSITLVEEETREKAPWIKVRYLDNVIESFMLKGEEPLKVGSAQDNDICLADESVSSEHCWFFQENDKVVVETPSLEQQIMVDNALVQRQELREGNRIKVGNYLLFFLTQNIPIPLSTENKFQLEPGVDLDTIAQQENFSVEMEIRPETLPLVAGLLERMLGQTNLSDLKKGVIPTAFVETLQMLKTDQTGKCLFSIQKAPARFVFKCRQFSSQGYYDSLSTFKRHRESLMEVLQEKESFDEQDLGVGVRLQDELMKESGMQSSLTPASGRSSVGHKEEDLDFDDLDDIEDFFTDPSILAAKVIVHSFDRIEFKKEAGEVELVVYL